MHAEVPCQAINIPEEEACAGSVPAPVHTAAVTASSQVAARPSAPQAHTARVRANYQTVIQPP